MRRLLLAVLCLALSTVCITSRLVAAPHFGSPWKLRQPDGNMVDVRIWGDEYYQVVETPDGYTLMREPDTQWIVYADVTPDGTELVSTGVRYTSANALPAGVFPHVRITSEAAHAQAMEARTQAFPETQSMYVGGQPKGVPPSTGNVKGLVLLADFDDIPATISKSEVENFCNQDGYSNNSNNGSVYNYYNDVSNGMLNYTCYVTDYHRAQGGDFATYYDDCSVQWLDRAKELIVEILDEMEANGFDFSQYDANGDGEIDAINLYFAGGGTSCGWAKGMWPGSGSMASLGWSADGKSANRYQITNMGAFLTLGTFCHENGHMVCGWPDLYDYDGDSFGAGQFDIMCARGSNTNPCEPGAELKRTAGWENVIDLPGVPTTGINLPVSSGNMCYRYALSATEFYLIENRQQTGRDAAMADNGLALWHVDTAKWLPNMGNDQQQRTAALHYYVSLVQADGNWDLENNTNVGDTTDLFGASAYTEVTPCTNPNTNWWDGSASGLSITNISLSQATMTFDFSPEDNDPVAVVKNYSVDPDESCCTAIYVTNINDGSYDPDGEGDIASICITAVDGQDKGCVQYVNLCDGTYTVTLTITDLCGNTDSEDATVTIINDPPVAIAQDFWDDADDNCCITVNLGDIDGGSYDPDGDDDIKSFCITGLDGADVDCKYTIEVCGEGFHDVEITITDWCDSTSTAVAQVEVIDVTPPTIEVTLDRDVLWPPNHKMVDICADEIVVEDNCDADPEVALYSIESDEPDNDKADGNTTDDIQGADIGTEDTCFALRSERQGTGDGRKYTIIYSATDNAGNVGYDTVCVRVPHDQSANASSSLGFIPDGTSLEFGVNTFALIVPGTASLDVSKIDPDNVYIGNTRDAIRATSTKYADITGDGIRDMAAMYESLTPEQLAAAIRIIEGTGDGSQIEKKAISDGPIGLHFEADGVDYLVPDIYALGEPRELPIFTIDDGPITHPGGDPEFERATTAKVTGLTSIHPNPFNPQTTVDFSLANSGRVRIAVYDVRGSLVHRLVDETMPAGSHQARWNGTDEKGLPASSGVYFVRMIAGSYQEVRKIVMLK